MANQTRSPFYLTIPSDTSFQGNSLNNFRVKHNPIHLEGEWQVALAEMIYPNSHYNLTGCYIDMEVFQPNIHLVPVSKHPPRLTLANRHYSNVDELIASLQSSYSKYWADRENEIRDIIVPDDVHEEQHEEEVELELGLINAASRGVIFAYSHLDLRIKITILGSGVYTLKLNEKLNYALGYRNHMPLPAGQHTAEYPPDLNVSTQNMYIYTDIIEPQMVGPTMTRLLKIIPIKGIYGDQQSVEFRHMHYVNILVNDFDSVLFSIKDQTGVGIAFTNGQVIMKLHFKKKSLLS